MNKLFTSVILIAGLSLFLNQVSAENHTYNYQETEQNIKDLRTVETCIEFQINSDECDLLYGGVTDSISDGRIK